MNRSIVLIGHNLAVLSVKVSLKINWKYLLQNCDKWRTWKTLFWKWMNGNNIYFALTVESFFFWSNYQITKISTNNKMATKTNMLWLLFLFFQVWCSKSQNFTVPASNCGFVQWPHGPCAGCGSLNLGRNLSAYWRQGPAGSAKETQHSSCKVRH